MSNIKTLRSLAKRVKISASGKILRRRAGMSHNLSCKSRKRKRFLKHQVVVSAPIARKVKTLLRNA